MCPAKLLAELRFSWVLLLVLVATPGVSRAADFAAASANAHKWLKSQIVSTGLVDSYRDKSDICYSYDQAVAAMAFVARGDFASARGVFDALAQLQNADGSWNHSYACKTGTVLGAQRYVGSNAWIVLAIAHYEKRSGDTVTYHVMGESAVNWMRLFQQGDGGLNGGYDANGAFINWASTEHNEDAYGGLNYFAYPSDGAEVKSFLDNVVWNPAQVRWNQGRNDPVDPLDVNPLGVSALGPAGVHPYQLSLNYAYSHHRNVQTWGRGRNRVPVDGFDFNSDHDDIWVEGTAQMAKALLLSGWTADSDYFLEQLLKTQSSSGGLPYSVKGTFNGDFTMSKNEAVASTGWLILAIENINPLRP
jgi:hypothetical protein